MWFIVLGERMDCRGVFGGVAFWRGDVRMERLWGWRFLCRDGRRVLVGGLDFCTGWDFVVIAWRIEGGI